MKRLITLIAIVLMVISYATTATTAPPKTELTSFSPPEEGWGRIYISSGHFKAPPFNKDLKGPRRTGPVYINDVKVGVVAYQEYICVDLLPGSYEVYWELSKPDKMFSEKLILNVEANEIRSFTTNMINRGMGGVFGLVGALTSEYLTKGFLIDEPSNGEGRLVSEYKFADNAMPNSTQKVVTPDMAPSTPKNAEPMKFDKQATYSRFLKLKELYEKELITKEEYDKERQELLEKL